MRVDQLDIVGDVVDREILERRNVDFGGIHLCGIGVNEGVNENGKIFTYAPLEMRG